MNKVEEASGVTIRTYTCASDEYGFIMLGQEFIEEGRQLINHFVTLGAEDIKELIPELQEWLKKNET